MPAHPSKGQPFLQRIITVSSKDGMHLEICNSICGILLTVSWTPRSRGESECRFVCNYSLWSHWPCSTLHGVDIPNIRDSVTRKLIIQHSTASLPCRTCVVSPREYAAFHVLYNIFNYWSPCCHVAQLVRTNNFTTSGYCIFFCPRKYYIPLCSFLSWLIYLNFLILFRFQSV